MAILPAPKNLTVRAIYALYETGWLPSLPALPAKNNAEFRPHLGASQIGDACSRKIWYSFRWAARRKIEGRMLRLMHRGDREEIVLTEELRVIGVQVWDKSPDDPKKQIGFTFGGHFSGSVDAIGLGFPEAPKTPHVTEYKTSSDKYYKELCSKGVQAAKEIHFAQTQVCMKGVDLTRAMYLAVNKNTDEIYQERIYFEPLVAQGLVEKAHRIIDSSSPMPKISDNPGWYTCKWCDYVEICHHGGKVLESCRTCCFSQPVDGGKWVCEGKDITEQCRGIIYKCSRWERFREFGDD